MPKLPESEIMAALAGVEEWKYDAEKDMLVMECEFKNFVKAMEFINRVAKIAESLNHHPDITVHGWNKVRIATMSHDLNTITERDIALVDEIQRLF
mgnify:CR=1 FL=1|tara:strand:- start:2311 stop:2598 length:288 start_codon:yes stop_codon:yes gene_type:complete